jgi:transcriptional regulator with XRE-family HTH domain
MTGEEIKKYRVRLGLSQEAFAELLGARSNQISRWENDFVTMGKLYKEKLEKVLEARGIQTN